MSAGVSANIIKALDSGSAHKITSGQVVVDLQTAVKELVENSLDAGATNIEVRFKDQGLESFEVIDNGSGISPADYDSIALKHHTSKLSSFTDLEIVATFGFRGEALSSLCALAQSVSVTTATSAEAPAGTVIEFERTGKAKSRKGKAARQRGTTVTVTGLFAPLPVRRKELERNAKREFGKALTLLYAYALVPCATENNGVRLSVTNQPSGGRKSTQMRTDGTPSIRASVSAIWGPKTLDNLVDIELNFDVEVEAAVLRRLGKNQDEGNTNRVQVRGLISRFSMGCGRNGTDRQFFFVNGRPCAPSKVQKAFNEVYRTFNATQSPFIIADFILPTRSCDINVSPDKRTILIHSENNLIQALKVALEEKYAPARSTFDVNASQATRRAGAVSQRAIPPAEDNPLFLPDDVDDEPSISAPVSSQDSTEQPLVPPRSTDERVFGEPHLLVAAPLSSQSSSSQDAMSTLKDAEGPAASGTRSTPTNTVSERKQVQTPVVHHRDSPSSSSCAMEVQGSSRTDDDEQGAPAVSRSSPHPTTASTSAFSEDPPIFAVRPPARPVTRSLPSQTLSPATSRPPEQMVLSTSGASWSLRRQDADEARPRKRARRNSGEGAANARSEAVVPARSARQGMRDLLRGFARSGSKVEEPAMDVDEDEVGELRGSEKDDDEGSCDDSPDDRDGMQVEAVQDQAPDDVREDTPDPEPTEHRDVDMESCGNEDIELVEDEGIQPIEDVVELPRKETLPSCSQDSSDGGTKSTIMTAVSGEIIRVNDREGISFAFDLSRVTSAWQTLQARMTAAQRMQEDLDQQRPSVDAGSVNMADDEATEALSRVIDKTDFASMKVVGQFNLGFIVVRRKKASPGQDERPGTGTDDLFIVDQHAADEKYNFETLQQNTKIDCQKLFQPQVLELTAADELVALENIDILRQNGFELEVCEDRPPGQRLRLDARPISKSTVFDTKDLEELLHLLQERPMGQMVRCSKARAMFAMRACRMSIMIGKPLSHRQMVSVVQHMGTMDQPWHCPHGRPTMRHLSDIAGVRRDRQQGLVDWAAFGRAGL
ncbi:hypothetical protein BC628DRAFT_1382209 [Trametes gibbosa]|nr:hypothetical protein BC628DRAFT_1382209 [Trametes gibbosa]